MPVRLRDGYPQVEFRRLGHLLELADLILVELGHAVLVTDDAVDGQVSLGNLDHPLDLIGVGDQEHEVVLVGAVFLQAPLVLEEFENEVGGRAGLGRLHAGRRRNG